MVNIRANCNNILTAYPDARSLSFACRRLQFNKLRFYLYDNIPVDFTRCVVEDKPMARSMLGPLIPSRALRRKKKASKRRESLVAIHYVIH